MGSNKGPRKKDKEKTQRQWVGLPQRVYSALKRYSSSLYASNKKRGGSSKSSFQKVKREKKDRNVIFKKRRKFF